jgi:hypothetical protein
VTAPFADRTRPAALAAGPVAVAALVLFFAALAVHGDDVGAITRNPLGIGANVLALLSLLLLLVGLVRLAARPALADAAGTGAVLLAGAGTVLAAGGAWAQLVTLPVFAVQAPQVANEGATPITAAYVGSFLVAGLGWLLVAVLLRRDDRMTRARTALLVAGAVLLVLPLPTRWFLLAIAVSLLARDEAVAADEPRRAVAVGS